MSSTLDRDAAEVLGTRAKRELNHVLVGLQRATGKSYQACYDEFAHTAGEHGGSTRAVVKMLGADVGKVEAEVRVLEQADAARESLHQRAAALVLLEAEAARDIPDPGSFTTPEAVISRFAKANRLGGGYDDAGGFDRFRAENEQFAKGGHDLLARLQAPATQRTAAAIVDRHEQTIARVANGDGDAGTRIRALSQLAGDGLKQLEAELGGGKQLATAAGGSRRAAAQFLLEAPFDAAGGGIVERAFAAVASRGGSLSDTRAVAAALNDAARGL
jgi:hypothetical protein